MEPSKDQKVQASQQAIKSVLGMADDQKSKMKSVKIKIKFDTAKKMAAVRKKAKTFGLADKNGVTR
jgi:hypothetical protein